MRKSKKFPQFLFVARVYEGTKDEYLNTSQDPAGALAGDGPTAVGTYKLVEVKEFSKRVVSKDIHGNY